MKVLVCLLQCLLASSWTHFSRRKVVLYSSWDDGNDSSRWGDSNVTNWENMVNPNWEDDVVLHAEEKDDMLDTLQDVVGEEYEFIEKEADRADKVRQMQEFGYSNEAIINTLDVSLEEVTVDNPLLDAFNEEGFGVYAEDEVDKSEIESHQTVDLDEETGEPVRLQMVYVDEVACIGCTNCAMIAQSTFFMEPEHGRARVFEQWGDDDETIQIAIETCPVDCIHYIPYDELVSLEKDRRGQNINYKSALVGGDRAGHMVGGSVKFSEQQQISGNMGSRCNNCPSKGCEDCPMFGVGKNPAFQKREEERKQKQAKRKVKERLKQMNRSAEI